MVSFARELWWDLRGNRTNSILSLVSLFVALLSFTMVSALGQLSSDAMLARTAMIDGEPPTYRQELTSPPWSSQLIGTVDHELRVWNQAGVPSALCVDFPGQLAGAATRPVTIRGVLGDYRGIRRVIQASGQWPSSDPYPGQAAVNQALAGVLPTGATLHLQTGGDGTQPLTVSGVVTDGRDQPTVYVDLPAFYASTPWHLTATSSTLLFRTPDAGQLAALTGSTLPRLGLAVDGDPARADHANDSASQMQVITGIFTAITFIALVVAALGMMNVGLAGVRERARDFTVRRAAGASQRRIIIQVLGETVVIGIAATLMAGLVSYLLLRLLLPRLLPATSGIIVPTYPWKTAGLAALIGLAVSAGSGLAPAIRTRSLDLVSLLRD